MNPTILAALYTALAYAAEACGDDALATEYVAGDPRFSALANLAEGISALDRAEAVKIGRFTRAVCAADATTTQCRQFARYANSVADRYKVSAAIRESGARA